jgi:hypothetical protein
MHHASAQVEASDLSLVSCLSSFSSDLISPSIPSVDVRSHYMFSFALLHTLSIMFRLHALQLKPSPVDDLVGEDGDQNSLEYWSTAILVEVALTIC